MHYIAVCYLAFHCIALNYTALPCLVIQDTAVHTHTHTHAYIYIHIQIHTCIHSDLLTFLVITTTSLRTTRSPRIAVAVSLT